MVQIGFWQLAGLHSSWNKQQLLNDRNGTEIYARYSVYYGYLVCRCFAANAMVLPLYYQREKTIRGTKHVF